MKKFSILMLFAALFLIHPSDVHAQIRVSLNINLQPQWGPESYDHVEYYYMPEVGIYYYAPKAQFIYLRRNQWVVSYELPYQYRHLDLFHTYKVVINESRPYLRNSFYVSHYKKYKNYHSKQRSIRDSKNPKYGNRNDHQARVENRDGNRPQNRKVQTQVVRNDRNARPNVDKNRKGKDHQGNRGNNDKKNDRK